MSVAWPPAGSWQRLPAAAAPGRCSAASRGPRLCRLKPFGAELRAVRRSPWRGEHPAEALLDERGGWDRLHALAADADVLMLACSQNEQTRGLVDAALLAACKPGVLVVNVARGAPRPG